MKNLFKEFKMFEFFPISLLGKSTLVLWGVSLIQE